MIIYSIRLFKLYLKQQSNSRIEIIIDFVDHSNLTKSVVQTQQFNLQVPDRIKTHQTKNEHKNRQLSGMMSLNSHQKIIIVENFNNKLTRMSILISSMSILSHLGLTAVYISYSSNSFSNSEWSHYANFLTFLFILLKYISNFFLFFFYNKNLRIYIYKILISIFICVPGIKLKK